MAGLVLGAASIFSLISTCLQCFELIESSRTYAEEHTLLSIKYEVEKTLFLIWGDAAGLSRSEGTYKNSLDKCFIRPVVEKILIQIKVLFNETSELKSKYGLKLIEDEDVIINESKMAVTTQNVTAFNQHLIAFQKKVDKQQRMEDIAQKARWAIRDHKNFQKLVNYIRELNDGLRDITPDLRNTESNMLRKDISDVEDPGDLRLIEEACAGSNPDWCEAASLCIEASDRSSTGRDRVSEWINALPSENNAVSSQKDLQSVAQTSEDERDSKEPEVFTAPNRRKLPQLNISSLPKAALCINATSSSRAHEIARSPLFGSKLPPELFMEACRQNLDWQPLANKILLGPVHQRPR